MSDQPRFRPGQPILVRETWDGKVWSARPEIVVQDSPELLGLYMPAGALWKQPVSLRGDRVGPRDRLMSQWVLKNTEWLGQGRLRLTVPGSSFSLLIFWKQDHSVRQWYVNLEDPLCRTRLGFDYIDQLLDAVLTPDLGEWAWKDEDELEEAVSIGLISDEKAAALHEQGQRAVGWLQSGKSPFNGWEKWRPDPSWPVPVLPEGWDVI